jgi:hypothetical protein
MICTASRLFLDEVAMLFPVRRDCAMQWSKY